MADLSDQKEPNVNLTNLEPYIDVAETAEEARIAIQDIKVVTAVEAVVTTSTIEEEGENIISEVITNETDLSMHSNETQLAEEVEVSSPDIEVQSEVIDNNGLQNNAIAGTAAIENDIQNKVTKIEQIVEKADGGAIAPSEIVVIHAHAIIENSPNSVFVNDEWGSILRFLASKEHLRKNIADVKCCNSTSRELSSGLFSHMVKIEILVRTGSLWETPRSYIWRNIGQDTWERGNSSSVKLTRIHQK